MKFGRHAHSRPRLTRHPPSHPTVDLARQMAMAGWKSAGDRSSKRSISSYILYPGRAEREQRRQQLTGYAIREAWEITQQRQSKSQPRRQRRTRGEGAARWREENLDSSSVAAGTFDAGRKRMGCVAEKAVIRWWVWLVRAGPEIALQYGVQYGYADGIGHYYY